MRIAVLAFLLSATGACSASSSTAASQGGADAGAVHEVTFCDPPSDPLPAGATCVFEAKGKVEDMATGAPLTSRVMTFCGAICYGAESDDAGTFLIPIGQFLNTGDYALHADGRPDHAVDYLRFASGVSKVISTTMRLPALPSSQVQLPPDDAGAASVTEGDLTLSVPAGTTFVLDIEDVGTVAGRTLRVAAVPIASAPSYARDGHLDAVYALAPSGAAASNPMGLTLTNSAKIPAGSAVDVLVLGDDYFSVPPNVGTLSVVASAHVSSDGKTIQTDPGEGIVKLTWLGVRRKGS